MQHKLHLSQGLLECYVYSVKNSEIEKKIHEQQQKEKLGIDSGDDDEKIYGEPIEMIIDLKSLGDPIFFTPNKVELFEEGNFVDAIHVEFKNDLDFVFLITFKDFKKLYYDYKGISNGN